MFLLSLPFMAQWICLRLMVKDVSLQNYGGRFSPVQVGGGPRNCRDAEILFSNPVLGKCHAVDL